MFKLTLTDPARRLSLLIDQVQIKIEPHQTFRRENTPQLRRQIRLANPPRGPDLSPILSPIQADQRLAADVTGRKEENQREDDHPPFSSHFKRDSLRPQCPFDIDL
jgi:hypothetical protein